MGILPRQLCWVIFFGERVWGNAAALQSALIGSRCTVCPSKKCSGAELILIHSAKLFKRSLALRRGRVSHASGKVRNAALPLFLQRTCHPVVLAAGAQHTVYLHRRHKQTSRTFIMPRRLLNHSKLTRGKPQRANRGSSFNKNNNNLAYSYTAHCRRFTYLDCRALCPQTAPLILLAEIQLFPPRRVTFKNNQFVRREDFPQTSLLSYNLLPCLAFQQEAGRARVGQRVLSFTPPDLFGDGAHV